MTSDTRSHLTTGARKLAGLAASAAVIALLAGCTTANEPTAPEPTLSALSHVHEILPASSADAVLLGTHEGLYTVDRSGEVVGPLGGNDFDAMGLTNAADGLVASGHPGSTTPAELGSPHLGIIRSDDSGTTWYSQAFAGTEDFHTLTSGPDGVLYGVGSSTTAVRSSTDGGATWSAGADVGAVDLTVTAEGWLLAATADGLQRSGDGGTSFTVIADTPLFYQLTTTPDGTVVGVDTAGVLRASADGTNWSSVGAASGSVQALGASTDGAIVLIDDRGLVWIDGSGETVIPLS